MLPLRLRWPRCLGKDTSGCSGLLASIGTRRPVTGSLFLGLFGTLGSVRDLQGLPQLNIRSQLAAGRFGSPFALSLSSAARASVQC
jgi:hypothetical protein